MKKLMIIVLLLIALAAQTASAEATLALDELRAYDKMARPYAQGYSPLIEGNTAHVVLPLLSDTYAGDLVAEFIPLNPDSSPIKLSNAFTQTVKRGTYTFGAEKVEAYRVYFKLALYPSRRNGEYPCKIAVRGTDAAGNAFTQKFPITLRITDGYESGEAPDLRVEAFDTEAPLYVGEQGALRMTVANRSDAREARNIALTLADSSGDILPVSSDTVSVGTLAAGESADLEIPVRALAKAAAEPHALQLALTYEYGDGRMATKTEKHTVDLTQEVRLNHTEAALPARVTQGENVAFSLTLMNMGKGKLYNALLTFDVPHMAAGGSVLAGNVEPGASVSANANLRVDSDYLGEAGGTLTLTWEDGYGVGYEKTLPLNTTVIGKPKPPASLASASGAADMPDLKPGPREIAAWCLSGVLALSLGAVSIRFGRKIRRLEEKQL